MLNIFTKSRFPSRLPIQRVEDYHTHYLGKCGDGRLFFGYETFAVLQSYWESPPEEREEHRIEFAVLYLFDNKGKFREVKYWSSKDRIGTLNTSDKLEVLVQSLGAVEYCDIEVELFETEIEGIKFGLIPNEEAESIDLQPSSTISFQAPWDGEYYT